MDLQKFERLLEQVLQAALGGDEPSKMHFFSDAVAGSEGSRDRRAFGLSGPRQLRCRGLPHATGSRGGELME